MQFPFSGFCPEPPGKWVISIEDEQKKSVFQSVSASSATPALHAKVHLLEPIVQNVRLTSTAKFHMSAIRSKNYLKCPNYCVISVSDVITVEGPAFAESISEGDIRWLKQKGDHVNEDELVAEIETDKTSVEVPAPQAGTIVELLVEDGAKVTAKQKLYKLQPGAGGGAAVSLQSSLFQ